MSGNCQFRVLTPDEIAVAADWAAREGWNPGLEDAACFGAVDPEGFWGCFVDGQMIACISVVNYGADFAFLGFYITAPDWRGQGYGYQLWQKALVHAGSRTVGLDGVVDQQDNYRKSGFALAYRNIRFGGVPAELLPDVNGVVLEQITKPGPELEALDAQLFPAPRTEFWQRWLAAEGHLGIAARENGVLTGFGTLRPCRSGYKIGPLAAADRRVAEAVLARLLQALPEGAEVFLDVPEPNAAAVGLARALGLEPVFETARMYRGPAPEVDVSRIFGVTTFELG